MNIDLYSVFAETFGRPPAVISSAPGRVEFIGNHTDYNGGLVLGAGIDRSVKVAAARREDDRILLKSLMETQEVHTSLARITRQSGAAFWANYPLGVLESLTREGLRPDRGFDFLVASEIHAGAGLSSSAAFELASALAFCRLYGLELSREQLVSACRRAENEFVGVPCGILDQSVSCFARPDHLVLIDCREITFKTVAMPRGLEFWIFNTNVKHNLVSSLYATRHQECMEAWTILKSHLPDITCLCDVSAADLKKLAGYLPKKILPRARHVIEENQRVKEMISALARQDIKTIGQLLYASHASSRTLFENSCRELDTFVEILQGRPEVIGARLTGGGFGGAVLALTTSHFTQEDASQVAADYAARFENCCPAIFHARTGEGAHVL